MPIGPVENVRCILRQPSKSENTVRREASARSRSESVPYTLSAPVVEERNKFRMTNAVIERGFKKLDRGDGEAQRRLDEARADSLRLSEKLPEGPAW